MKVFRYATTTHLHGNNTEIQWVLPFHKILLPLESMRVQAFTTQSFSYDFMQNRNEIIVSNFPNITLWIEKERFEWPSWCDVHNNGLAPFK
jgi:hypothetical protein